MEFQIIGLLFFAQFIHMQVSKSPKIKTENKRIL